RPAGTDDPRLGRMTGGVRCDRLEVAIETAQIGQVAPQSFEPRQGHVRVRIAEPGRDRPTPELDHTRAWTDPPANLDVRPDRRDPPSARGERLDPWPRAVHGLDPAVEQDEVGRGT